MSGFSERLSNLPPGVTDADIERQANGGFFGELSMIPGNTIPETWKIVDEEASFVAQFARKEDAIAFLENDINHPRPKGR